MTQVKTLNKTNWEVAEINKYEVKIIDLTFWSFLAPIEYKKRCCLHHMI